MADAQVVCVPFWFMLSLKAQGTPASSPGSSPAASFASTAAAFSRAICAVCSRKAFTCGSTASMRAIEASASSAAENAPAASPSRISRTPSV